MLPSRRSRSEKAGGVRRLPRFRRCLVPGSKNAFAAAFPPGDALVFHELGGCWSPGELFTTPQSPRAKQLSTLPQLATALRTYRRRVGRKWIVEEVFCFRGTQKLYVYRAVDEHGQVIDVLLRDQRNRASAEAFFRQALARTDVPPKAIITDHHQAYVKAAAVIPFARPVRTGLHRRRGYTTQPIERSHVPTRDRLRGARGLRTVHTGQRFLESFEGLHALRRGDVKLRGSCS
jgi:transposase-like protein